MLKLFKLIKPYKWELLLILILVTISSVSNLILPDKMATIIGEGISAEIQYEQTASGEDIYIDFSEYASFINVDEEIKLPKFKYQDAGILVTYESEGKQYAKINKLGIMPIFEKDSNGDIVYLRNPIDNSEIPIPQFKRTSNGEESGEVQQGTLLLDASLSPQIERKQISNFTLIINNGLQMLGFTLLSTICAILVSYYSSKVGNNFGRDIRGNLFSRVIAFTERQENKFGAASLITRNTNDGTQVENFVIQGLRIILMVPVMFFGGLILSLNKDTKMTMVLLISIPIIIAFIIIVAKILMPLFRLLQKKIDRLTLVSRENISGVRVIRAFGGDKKESEKFRQANLDLTNIAIKQARIMAILLPAMTIIMSFTTIAIVLISIINVNKILQTGGSDFTQIGNMMAVSQYVMQIMMSIIMFAIIFILYPRAEISANRINEVLDTQDTEIYDKEGAIKEGFSKKGEIEFRNVSYYFEEAEKPALKNINFICHSGEVTAIIGSTGSGKSTLVNLIPRLYEATSGEILVDGVSVKDIEIKTLRNKIGFATQTPNLMSGTINDNILYGASDTSDKNMLRAASIAQAHDFIQEKEGGYSCLVEQKGANFSGGQKQRLSIARAISRKSEFLIFDDSFSALDFTTDAKLRKAIKENLSHTTIIIVAQRIGSVMDADNIIVLDEGAQVGGGKHKELLHNCPIYRNLALSQMSELELGLGGEE